MPPLRWLAFSMALLMCAPMAFGGTGPSLVHVPASCSKPAKGKFLVASRRISDPRFAQSVILLVDHDDQGTLGLIINRRTDVSLAQALPHVEALRRRDDKLFFGGPVSRRLVLVLMRAPQPPPGAVHVFASVYFSQGTSLLDRVLGSSLHTFRVYAGYAGWAPGQLGAELARGDWFVTDADEDSIFTATPSSLWPALIFRFEGQWAFLPLPQPGC